MVGGKHQERKQKDARKEERQAEEGQGQGRRRLRARGHLEPLPLNSSLNKGTGWSLSVGQGPEDKQSCALVKSLDPGRAEARKTHPQEARRSCQWDLQPLCSNSAAQGARGTGGRRMDCCSSHFACNVAIPGLQLDHHAIALP